MLDASHTLFGILQTLRMTHRTLPNLAENPTHVHITHAAAVEIQYSKAENKDARYLAEVMRFKIKAKEAGMSEWQVRLEFQMHVHMHEI